MNKTTVCQGICVCAICGAYFIEVLGHPDCHEYRLTRPGWDAGQVTDIATPRQDHVPEPSFTPVFETVRPALTASLGVGIAGSSGSGLSPWYAQVWKKG